MGAAGREVEHARRLVEVFRDPARVFLVVSLVVGTTLCFLLPTLDGIDEASHLARSHQMPASTSTSPTIGPDRSWC